MYSKSKYYEVMGLIGCGLSVQTICDRAGISFDDLCEVCAHHTDLEIELKKWFPKYDFTVKETSKVNDKVTLSDIKEETDEGKEGVSAGKQSSRKPKRESK